MKPQAQLSWVDIEKLLDDPKQKVRASLIEDAETKRLFHAKIEKHFNRVQFMYQRIKRIM